MANPTLAGYWRFEEGAGAVAADTTAMAVPSYGAAGLSDIRLGVFASGSATPAITSTTGSLNYIVAADGTYFVRVEGLAKRALRAQYVLTAPLATLVQTKRKLGGDTTIALVM